MALMIRQIAEDDTLEWHLCLDALAQVLPPATVATVLAECDATEARVRKLPALVTLLFCSAMNLYTADDLAHVCRRLVAGLRWLWPDPAGLRVSGLAPESCASPGGRIVGQGEEDRMGKVSYTEEQIVAVLRRVEGGTPAGGVCPHNRKCAA